MDFRKASCVNVMETTVAWFTREDTAVDHACTLALAHPSLAVEVFGPQRTRPDRDEPYRERVAEFFPYDDVLRDYAEVQS